jgi:UDP-N-acetylglucosamine--N-acetylmuramyl-(pentapeptide) pyrophosphoryl-undecaprenol N-acetylglucosamine transferase
MVPGLHLLAHVRARGDAAPIDDLVWFTSGRAVEERVMSSARAASFEFERVALPLEPEGGGAPTRTALCLRTPRAFARARAALRRHRSDVLLGLGGFTALPAVLAARSLGIPVALLEVNARRGAATRWLARCSQRVFHAWPSTLPARDRDSAHAENRRTEIWIGPPLAPEFQRAELDRDASARARASLGFDPDRPLLVVLGGSQGALALNAFVRAHAPALVAHGIQVLHQTGPQKLGEGCPPFSGYVPLEWVDPVEGALAAATLVLCRGGASTLAEVAALRAPTIVVPYPHHADRHQEHNARELGAGVRIAPEERLGLALRDEIARLCGPFGAHERERMRDALARAMPVDGSERLYLELCALAREASGASPRAELAVSSPAQSGASRSAEPAALSRDELDAPTRPEPRAAADAGGRSGTRTLRTSQNA